MVDGSAFLHPVQGLYVRGPARPRSIAVRAASRLGAPAQHVRGRGDSALDGPRDRGPLGTQPSFDALRQASEPEAA